MWKELNESLSQFCSSTFWDTNLTWNSPDPEFTECFEKTFLVWIPCLFLWLFLPVEIFLLLKTRAFNIPFNYYNVSKLMVIAIIGALAVSDIVCYNFFSEEHNYVDLYSPLIRFITFCLVFVLTYVDIIRGIRTSAVLFLFTSLLALCGLPAFRSVVKLAYEDKVDAESISYLLYYPLALALFVLNCFADARPTITNYQIKKDVCPENDVSFLSKILFSWFDGFMWRGYRNPLKEVDIWNLDHEMDPQEITQRFEPQWLLAVNRIKKKNEFRPWKNSTLDRFKMSVLKDHRTEYEPLDSEFDVRRKEASILGPLFRTFGWTFTFGVTLKLAQSGLQFVSPVILNLLIAFIADENEFMWHGYLYAVLLLLVAFLQTILLMKHFHILYRVGVQIRTALISVIYKKALKISNGAKKDFTLGQIVNLMAVDAQRFLDLMILVPLLAVIPMEIILCLYFLWNILGPSVLAGLAVLLIMGPVNAAFASRIQKLQIQQMKRKDERVKLINEILSGIKVLKLYAWEPSFEKEVVQIRDGEIELLRSTAFLNAGTTFTLSCTPFLVSLVTFAVFVLSSEENVLDAQVAFVSLSLFNLLKFPLGVLPIVISSLVQSYVAVKRISKFLNSEELDPNAVTHEPRSESIIIENGDFSWHSVQGPLSLSDINLRIEPGSLVAVVGPVGAGKSSLLSAILGEMYKQSGMVNTYGSIAYVPQHAWIRNATVKDNITLGDTTKNSFYAELVEACALEPDFKMLAAGDRTEIGERGINLSGGQKQRISLARAVFSKSEIYLLDDPLSAVDANVGKHIFEQVIGPNGLLKGKTRILVTHSIAYLPQVDNIIVLQNGFISESGTYNELLEREGSFANFLTTYQTKEDDLPTEEESEQSTVEEEISVDAEEGNSPEPPLRGFYKPAIEAKTTAREAKLIEAETSEAGTIKWSVFAYYLRAAGAFAVILTILMNLSYQVFTIATNIWLSIWSSDATSGPKNTEKQLLYLGVYGGFGLGQVISVVSRVLTMYLAMLKAGNYIHSRLLSSILRWPVTTFDTIPSGRIINRFGFDIDVLDNVLPNNFSQLLDNTGNVISTLFMICYSTPAFIYVLIPFGIIYFCTQRFFIVTSRQLKRLESVAKSPIYSHFGETVTGAASIRAYGLEPPFILASEDKVSVHQKCSYTFYIASRWLAIRLELLGSLIVFFAALFTVLARDSIDASVAGLSVSYSLQMTDILYMWARSMTESETNVVAIERIKEYSEMPEEAPWTLPNEVIPDNWPDKGQITFENFRVRYRAGLELVLKGISFHVNGGEKVGIVGRTGAGKSSLTLCLFRLIEAAGGRIIIDEKNISKMGLHKLRNCLTIIPQDPVLFTGKLRMNLDPSQKYSDESIWRALDLANLKTVVSNLSFGLQHEITEGGGNFSVGQRQLICLARALLRKTRILILDEATAAVDLETDDLIQAIIKKEFEDCTVLTIAHRLNTVLDYDRIIVLDDGRIAEYDLPENLLRSKQSIFYRMAVDAGLTKNDATYM